MISGGPFVSRPLCFTAEFFRTKSRVNFTGDFFVNSFRPFLNSVQTRCILKGEAQKSPLFWRFSGGFWFSQDRLFSGNSTRKPLNLIKSPIFTNAPCKTTCLYNAPSMHTADFSLEKEENEPKNPRQDSNLNSGVSRPKPTLQGSGLENYLNSYYQAKVGKELPEQFPEPLSVGKLDIGNLHSQILQTLCKPELPKIFSGRVSR